MLNLEYPYMLGFILLFIIASRNLSRKPQSYYIPHLYDLLPRQRQSHLQSLLKWITVCCSVLALSSPIMIKGVNNLSEKSIDIVLSLDTSGSMSTYGFNEDNTTQNRWDVVKDVVKDFMQARSKDRIGVVLFGDRSSIASPLSYDNEVQINILDQVFIGVLGKSTALIDSVVTSISMLKKSKNPSKVIILLSDGEDTSSQVPLDIALKFAKKQGIKIYTISIGESNNNMLELIAQESKAQSFLANNKKDLDRVYQTIDKIERHQSEGKRIKIIEYLYPYPLTLALLSALLLSLISLRSEEI